MKIRSLVLGSVAAAGLSTAGYAADLGVLTSLDVCDALGLSGLTISSDTNCLQISGSVDYRLENVAGVSGSKATRVDVTMSYVLTGPLAQIGRSGMVRDLVRRLGETFAQNLDAQLRDPAAVLPATQLGGLTLMGRVLADRLRALLTRIRPR